MSNATETARTAEIAKNRGGPFPWSCRGRGFATKREAVAWDFLVDEGARFYAGGPEILAAAEVLCRGRHGRMFGLLQGAIALGQDLRNAGAGRPAWWPELAERLGLTPEERASIGASKIVLDP